MGSDYSMAWHQQVLDEGPKAMHQIEKIKYAIREWSEKQGHECCHYYPDIFREIATILEITMSPPQVPPRDEFEKGCRKFQDEIYRP